METPVAKCKITWVTRPIKTSRYEKQHLLNPIVFFKRHGNGMFFNPERTDDWFAKIRKHDVFQGVNAENCSRVISFGC